MSSTNGYDNTNRGSLFVNDKKQADNHPDFSGAINIEGREFYLSAWKQTSKAGYNYLSLSVKPKDQQPERKERPQDVNGALNTNKGFDF